MFELAWTTWDEVCSHPLRTLLTLLSVAIGVGAVVAIHSASSAARHAFVGLHDSLTGKVDLEVVAADGSRFDADATATVSSVPGVAHALPVLRRTTILYADGKRFSTSALGVDEADPRAVSLYAIAAGRIWRPLSSQAVDGAPDESSPARIEVVLENGLAEHLGIRVDDSVTFLLPRGPTRAVVIGLVSLRSATSLAENENVFFRLSDLQRAARVDGQIDQLRVQVAADQSREEVRKRLEAVLPADLAVRMPVTQTDLADATLRAADQGLKFAQAIALLMALFIILNTFLISVTQRHRQWGLLRAIGATQAQVLRMVLAEALAIGLAGSLVGLVLGQASARFLATAIAQMLETEVHQVELQRGVAVWVLLLGPALAILGCYVPARKACRTSPTDALRGDIPRVSSAVPWPLVALACAVWCCSFAVIAACAAERLAAWLAIPAGVGMLVGFVLMVPPLLPPVARAVTRGLLGRFWPVESQMAQDQVFQSKLRTSLTTAVVVVALANVIGLGHELLNSVDDVRDWYRRSMFADLILSPSSPEGAAQFGWKTEGAAESQIRGVANVVDVQTVGFVNVRANDRPALLIARSFRVGGDPLLQSADTTWPTMRAGLEQGSVVIGGMLAKRCSLKVGEDLRVEYAGRVVDFPVAAIVADYNYGGMSLYLDREFALRQLGIDRVNAFLVSLTPGEHEQSREALRTLGKRLQLTVYSFGDLRSWLDGLMDGVVAAFWVVLGLGLVVASFGIFNTITVNVLEQTQEIGLLRVVGMTQGQVMRTVIAQGLILAFLGILFGTLAGQTTAYLMHLCKGPLLGAHSAFHWRPGVIACANLVGMALIFAASYGPAHKASRLDALAGIQDE